MLSMAFWQAERDKAACIEPIASDEVIGSA